MQNLEQKISQIKASYSISCDNQNHSLYFLSTLLNDLASDIIINAMQHNEDLVQQIKLLFKEKNLNNEICQKIQQYLQQNPQNSTSLS